MNYTYILQCSDNTYYTGWTNDLEKRVKAHNSGKGCKYTHNRIPVELVYYESFATKADAMRREYAIKQLTRKQKEQLIQLSAAGNNPLLKVEPLADGVLENRNLQIENNGEGVVNETKADETN